MECYGHVYLGLWGGDLLFKEEAYPLLPGSIASDSVTIPGTQSGK